MSSLVTKATKRGLSASKRIRATKAKKATSRKPKRPGRITTAPKAKKASAAKRVLPAKKPKQTAAKKLTTRRTAKKAAPKKNSFGASARRNKAPLAKKASGKKQSAALTSARRRPAKAQSRKAMLARRTALAPKPLPAPPKKPPSPGTLAAVRAFEQALRLFNRHDFGPARSAFLTLLAKFADQAEIVARTRTYLAICEHRLARSPSVPRNPDALYNQGVFQFNRGNTADAIDLFEKALKVEPRADHVFYSLAAAHARLNDTAKAMDWLRRAIGLRPIHRSHARRDLDFVGLRTNEDFQQLTGFGFDLIEE
jgi:tetratricopeptide (TPR) repeat protein